MKHAGLCCSCSSTTKLHEIASLTDVLKSTGLKTSGKRKHNDQFDLCFPAFAHSSQWTAGPIRYAAQCLKSMEAARQSANPSRFSQTSDVRMTSFAMTERAPFYFRLRNARADRSPAKGNSGPAITRGVGREAQAIPLYLTGDALERCRA